LAGLFEEYVARETIAADQTDVMLEKIPTMFNWIKITPHKMILLHTMPGKFPLRKTWEADSQQCKYPGVI